MFEKSTSDARPESQTKRRFTPNSLRRNLYWLTLDWIHLHNELPTPTAPVDGRSPGSARRTNAREYGHPAEWASDKAAQIADTLHEWHGMLADYRNEKPPPHGTELIRVKAAWQYLETRCAQLLERVEDEALTEITDLHHGIRRALGQNTPRITLPMPCPNNECGLKTLQRIPGAGQDFIICGACGYTIKDSYYPLLIRMTLDAFVTTAA